MADNTTETGMNVSETMSFWKTAWSSMPSAGDVASNIKSGVADAGRSISDKVSSGLTHFRNVYDDNIVVPEGSTTMLGRDFRTLYGTSSIASASENASGANFNQIVSGASYGTEMMSANLNSTSGVRSIDTLTPTQRAAYEVVLLSKYYASQYSANAPASNDALAQAYTDDMVAYRQACDDQGIEWQSVMSYASWELQTQALEYKEDASSACPLKCNSVAESDHERVVSNRAHSMMLQCAPDGWEDTLLPHIAGRISYAETLDTDPREHVFLNNIKDWFTDKLEKVKNFVTSPWRALKSAVPTAIATADVIIEAGEAEHEANMNAYRETAESVKTTVDQVTDTIGEKAGPLVDAAKDKASALKDQAEEYFGLTSQEDTEEAGVVLLEM